MQQPISGTQLLGYATSSEGDTTFKSTNPKTGTRLPWDFHEATRSEADRAMELAAAASREFRNLPARERAAFLIAIAEGLEGVREQLLEVYCKETGLPEGRAAGELGRTQGQLRSFAALLEEGSWVEARIDTALPGRTPVPKPDIRKSLVALGPVVVFGASNFPLAFSTAGGDTASALAAGCPVVVKGHPLHPGTGEQVARCICDAAKEHGLPEGTFSYLQGQSHSLGTWLVQHPATAAVGFTGSREGGLALQRLASERERPIPVFAEMGSINPVVLLPSALDPKAGWVEAYAGSITLGNGQFCTNPGLLIAEIGPALDAFCGELARSMEAVSLGCMLDASIATRYRKAREHLLKQAGVHRVSPAETRQEAALVSPAVARVSGTDFLENPALQQEVFGPFTLVVGCRDRHELLRVIGSLEGQLTGSLLGSKDEVAKASEESQALWERVGRLLFNGVPTGVEVCPAMHHGGPYPATTDSRFTAVGTDAIRRWVRPVSFQNCPQSLLPEALRDENPDGILRWVNGSLTREPLHRNA